MVVCVSNVSGCSWSVQRDRPPSRRVTKSGIQASFPQYTDTYQNHKQARKIEEGRAGLAGFCDEECRPSRADISAFQPLPSLYLELDFSGNVDVEAEMMEGTRRVFRWPRSSGG